MMGNMQNPIRIAIIECDNPTFESINKRGNYGGIFTALLKAATKDAGLGEEDLSCSVFNVVENTTDYPNLEDIDGVLLSGSKYNAYDDNDWTNKLVAFVQEILKQDRVRIIGVCYGHQIVGRALGVKCAPNEKGWEVSVSKVNLTPEGQKLFLKDDLNIMQMHKDILYDYPASVEKLGSSPICDVQGMYTPRRFITVQGHPEFTQEIMDEILKARRDQGRFDDELFQDAMSRSGNAQDGLDIAAAFLRFMKDGR